MRLTILFLLLSTLSYSQKRILVLAEHDKNHTPYVQAAKPWLDKLAAGLGLRKQTILYWFPSKEALLSAVVEASAAELTSVFETALESAGTGWARVETVVRSVFKLAARKPE